MCSLLDQIKAGDKITILVPGGRGLHGREYAQRTGRAVMRGPAGWVLSMGGPHGTPGVACEENILHVPRLKYGLKVWGKPTESVTLGVFYPLAGYVDASLNDYLAMWTGEQRPPERGEWFLFGAHIVALQAPCNLKTSYCIARVAKVEKVTSYQEVQPQARM